MKNFTTSLCQRRWSCRIGINRSCPSLPFLVDAHMHPYYSLGRIDSATKLTDPGIPQKPRATKVSLENFLQTCRTGSLICNYCSKWASAAQTWLHSHFRTRRVVLSNKCWSICAKKLWPLWAPLQRTDEPGLTKAPSSIFTSNIVSLSNSRIESASNAILQEFDHIQGTITVAADIWFYTNGNS